MSDRKVITTKCPTSRRTLKAGNLLNDVQFGWDTSDGYWMARGFSSSEDGASELDVPFEDFFGNNSEKGCKKNLLSGANSMAPKHGDDVLKMFKGVLQTQQRAIPNGFFIYSYVLMHYHLTLCEMGRQFGCKATVGAITEALGSQPIDIQINGFLTLDSAKMGTEIAARLFYEGSGSLGGYNEKVWLLWGRLYGVGCPTKPELLDDESAKACAKTFYKLGTAQQKQMFSIWFMEAYKGEFETAIDAGTNGSHLLNNCISLFHDAFMGIRWYKKFESGKVYLDIDFNALDMDSIADFKSAMAGVFRRCSKGLTEAKHFDYSEAQHLSEGVNNFLPLAEGLLQDGLGMSEFGAWFIGCVKVSIGRKTMYDTTELTKKIDLT